MAAQAALVLTLTTSLSAADYQNGGFTYTLTSNLVYGRAVNDSTQGYEDLKLDVYATSNPATDKPAVLYVHGGGWLGGYKNDPEDTPTMQFLAQHGFVVFSIDYRLANDFDGMPNASLPLPGSSSVAKARYAGARDTKTAIRWIRANAAAYGISADRIVVMGPSAGGGNVVTATYTDPTDYATDYANDPYANYAGNNPGVSSTVQACVDLWGVTDWVFDEVNASDPPTLIAHGRIDITVNYDYYAIGLANACAAAGAVYELHPLVDPVSGEDYGHGPQAWGGVSEVNGEDINHLALNWFIDALGLTSGGGGESPLTVYAQAANDGWILESTETSNTGGSNSSNSNTASSLRAGDNNARRQYRSIVSFDTSGLPDNAVIDSVTLRLTRGTVAGNNANMSGFGTLNVAIKGSSGFGNNASLQNTDFSNASGAAPDMANVVAGGLSIPTANGQQTTGTLVSGALQYVNKTGVTQFRIDFSTDDDNDGSTDYLGFYSGENATEGNKPTLTINYHLP